MYTLEERLRYREYVTPKLARKAPIYDWYAFPHSFSKELVHDLIDEFCADKKGFILDPFVGAGTTLLACRERGVPAVGVDQLPFAVFASNVKLRDYRPDDLQRLLEGFAPKRGPLAFGAVPIVDAAFSLEARQRISDIYAWIRSLPCKEQAEFFLLALLCILGSVSRTTKSGGWLRLSDGNVDPDQVRSLFITRVQKMIDDVMAATWPLNERRWYATLGDCRYGDLPDVPVQHVITSPPYLNRHDYTRVFALEMALHFVGTNQELIALRTTAFRSHVEAKPVAQIRLGGYRPPRALTALVEQIEAASQGRDTHRVSSMIAGYFEDMYASLTRLASLVRTGGTVAFVIGNVRFSGVMIPVDELVAEIGQQVGLRPDKIIVARYRGNSAQQMAKFGRQAARESVVLWRKT